MVFTAFTIARSQLRSLLLVSSLFLFGGCVAKLPHYQTLSESASLEVISTRLNSVRNISATADLTLTNSQGQTASLDGALVACPPERARLRAWKFGSPVLDLTILPSGVWAFAVTSDGSPSTNLAGLPAAGISRSIEMLSGEYFAHARAEHLESTGEILVVLGTAFGREGVRCEIDRATLTPRRFVVPGGDTDLEIILDRYALIGDVAWAHRIEFRSPDGTIIIRLDDIELNGEIPENVFVPPSRATRIP